jgi:hypothetical protein
MFLIFFWGSKTHNGGLKKMKRTKRMQGLFVVMFMFLALGLVGIAGAQVDIATDSFTLTIDPIAVLDVDGILGNFTVTAPTLAGDDVVVSDSDDNTLLQYTSVVASASFRAITVSPSNTLPEGIILHVSSDHPVSGEGDLGDSVEEIEFDHLTLGAQNIVNNIGSCFTGTTSSDGARLTYWIEVDNIGDLNASTASITLTYTLTDDFED